MGAKTKDVGGGNAVGLADDTISSLQALLNTGGAGTAGRPDPFGSTGGIMGILSDLLTPGAGNAGKNLTDIFSRQQTRDVNAIRSRFGATGGAAFGTPAAFAESQYRAEAAPQIGQAITGLQLQAIQPLLDMIYGISQKGISQRQTIQQRSGLGQALGTVAQIGGAALPFLMPGVGSAAKAGLSAASGATRNYLDPGYQFGTNYKPKGFYDS